MTAIDRKGAIENLETLRDFVRFAASSFASAGLYFGHGTASALDESAALVLHALSLPYETPGGYFAARLTAKEKEQVLDLIERRVRERVPLAYLTHEAPFAGLSFYVDERVLVPRSPIAELIEQQFQPWIEAESVTNILDLCTGSGCIAIACAHAFPEAHVDAVDISPDAIEVAAINIDRLGVVNQVEAVLSDVYAGLEGRMYDIIVSNPPYVSLAEWQALPEEFHREPRLGLESGADGLDCVKRILEGAPKHLRPGGILIVEVGSAAEALIAHYPNVEFCWLDFERGGDGVFILRHDQLDAFSKKFVQP